ncbi:hypothetical protein BsWGS_15748 [Bradybaena similaris]
MGKRDFWPYDRHDWKKWAEHNKEYWAKWAEHNKNYWNSPQAQRYGRYMGRGRWIGRIVFFALGFWAGSYANQRYRLPSANPREAWEDMKAATENIRKDHPGVRDSPELNDILEKVKQLEKRYRRPQTSGDSQPQAAGDSQPSPADTAAPKSSE